MPSSEANAQNYGGPAWIRAAATGGESCMRSWDSETRRLPGMARPPVYLITPTSR